MKKPQGFIRRWLTRLLILLLAAIIAYLGVVGMLIWKVTHVPQTDDYDAMVVLGAQVRADGTLSLQLTWRLDAAVEAYQARPVPIVVCGAQGANEPAPEAVVMREYLIGKGVPARDILTDPDSYNTRQNIMNAAALLAPLNAETVLIVTSDYHLPRAMALAGDAGLSATGLGAPTKPEYWPKNYGREALSWIKYWAQKYLHLPLE